MNLVKMKRTSSWPNIRSVVLPLHAGDDPDFQEDDVQLSVQTFEEVSTWRQLSHCGSIAGSA